MQTIPRRGYSFIGTVEFSERPEAAASGTLTAGDEARMASGLNSADEAAAVMPAAGSKLFAPNRSRVWFTAGVIALVIAAILVGIGVRLKVLGALSLAGVAAMPLAWLVLKPYQRDRLLVYLDPFRDPLGTAYNVIQAKIAIGSGQLLGKGTGGATQSRLSFLPERHTDFIFAVFAEMWGFLGCLVLIVAYVLLVMRGFEIAAGTREMRGRILALGVTTVFAAQILINIGMVTGLLPIVGIPLPLMSYGGSSMVVSLTGLGLLLSIRMRQFH